MLFQITFIFFSFLAIVSIWKQYLSKKVSIGLTLAWGLFWVFADAVVLFPDQTGLLAHTFGIGRGVDFVLYIAVAVLFLLVFRLSLKIFMLEEHMTMLVRKEAIQKEIKKD